MQQHYLQQNHQQHLQQNANQLIIKGFNSALCFFRPSPPSVKAVITQVVTAFFVGK